MELTIVFDKKEIEEMCIIKALSKTYDLGKGCFEVTFNNRAYDPEFTCTWLPFVPAKEPAATVGEKTDEIL